jgi:hypothetical protein
MSRYTVVHLPTVDRELAQLWLSAMDRDAVTRASDAIDEELRVDAELKGQVVRGNLRRLATGPLWAYYVVEPDDCRVTLWSIRRAKK